MPKNIKHVSVNEEKNQIFIITPREKSGKINFDRSTGPSKKLKFIGDVKYENTVELAPVNHSQFYQELYQNEAARLLSTWTFKESMTDDDKKTYEIVSSLSDAEREKIARSNLKPKKLKAHEKSNLHEIVKKQLGATITSKLTNEQKVNYVYNIYKIKLDLTPSITLNSVFAVKNKEGTQSIEIKLNTTETPDKIISI